jgi:phage terminase small subunit
MGARGRKSAKSLTTISVGGIEIHSRPEPPEYLADDAKSIWRAITNTLPADWFSPGTLPLLEALCGLTISQRNTIKALQRIERESNDFERDEWERVLKQLGEISGRISTLATRMRLTPQSRYGARGADTAGRLPPDGPPPWEWDGKRGTKLWELPDEPTPRKSAK